MKKGDLTLIVDNVSVYPPHFYTAGEVINYPVSVECVVVKLIRDM